MMPALQNKDPTIWHQHLGHLSVGSLTALSVDFSFKVNKDVFGVTIFAIEQNRLEILS